MPSVSIIVPMYKVEKYLERCLKSILSQTLKNIEIILVNDGSPDKCLDIAMEYSKTDGRIKVIDKINGGVSSARNAGMKAALGDYLGFIDPDDWIMPEMFEKLYYSAASSECDAAVCNYTWAYQDGREPLIIRKLPEENILNVSKQRVSYIADFINNKQSAAKGLGLTICNKIFKRSFVEDNKLNFEAVSEVYSEDMLFMFNTLLHAHKISIVDSPLYVYFSREGSRTASYKPHAFPSLRLLALKIENKAREYGFYSDIKNILAENCYIYFWMSLTNETKSKDSFFKKYLRISSFVHDEWMRERILKVNKKQLTFKDKILFTAYKYRMTPIIYLMHLYLRLSDKKWNIK